MKEKLSNFFRKHRFAITGLAFLFIYLGSFPVFNQSEVFKFSHLFILIAGVILITGIFVNPMSEVKRSHTRKKLQKEAIKNGKFN